ncbi:inositol 1,4,5-triphosphate receptor associated 2 isoform X2 [Triplophysa dalaica]|nr:inositol 1,4,5-triphosphate receptor associated 2 isoform X2 [Triplophysa dalaica]
MTFEEQFVLKRQGPNSVDMTEEELEATFSQLSLSFCCDQYTLFKRLEAEEHARDKAENNLKLEVERGMEMLQTLKGMCLDIKQASLLQQIELCLSIIGSTVGRISNSAEVLGAVHQEVKSSLAVELMVAHVQNLKRHHERNITELEDMKKHMEKSNRERQACEQREDTEAFGKMEKDSQKPRLRRRISVSVISKQSQRHKFLESQASISVTNEECEEIESHANKPDQAVGKRQELFPEDNPLQTAEAPQISTVSSQPHHKKRHETDPVHLNKSTRLLLPSPPQKMKADLELSSALLKRSCKKLHRPLLQWLYHCQWIILVIYLTVLCSLLILAMLVWFLQTPVLWM